MINVLQIGLGPLGLRIFQYIAEKKSLKTVAALDIDPRLADKDLGVLSGKKPIGIKIKNAISDISNIHEVDVAVLTTSSNMEAITPQILSIVKQKIPVVSTCEELTFPWHSDLEAARLIDEQAKRNSVAVVSTGVNPGFLMDTLPAMLTGVCKTVDHVQVNRVQDARTRRIPFQHKIGAGLSLEEFDERKKSGSLRHVGLTESMHFIADSLGWELDHTEDVISPIVANKDIRTDEINIRSGNAMGVRQVGKATVLGKEKIKLVFEAAVGIGTSFDEIKISGEPNINSKIEGGVHGDIATCSIVLNAIPNILKSSPGLKTMRDISLVSFTR